MARAAQALVLVLVLLALTRAVTLELDPYDAYEVRTSARAVAGDPQAPLLVYRSALLTLAEAPLERWAHGSRSTWVFPHVLTALAYGGLALAAFALARAAGASREASWLAGLAVALDRLAFADAPLGLPDALAAALATWGLARGLALLHAPTRRRVLETGALLGLAAAARPNAGLGLLALLVAAVLADLAGPRATREAGARAHVPEPSGPAAHSWRESRLAHALLASGLAVAVYVFVATLVFSLGRGSLAAGLHAHAELATFQREQLAENARKYGSLFPPLGVYARAAFFMEPWTVLLLPLGLGFTLFRGLSPRSPGTSSLEGSAGELAGLPSYVRALVLVLASLTQLAFLCLLVGHGEARYLLPALVPLAALSALVLDALAARVKPLRVKPSWLAQAAVFLAWIALPLALGSAFELDRATDPTLRRNFSARVADEIARVSSSTARVLWTPDLPFPVYPAALSREGTPFRGDPFHGISHAGPVTVGYHLGRPILLLRRAGPAGSVDPRADLEALARSGTLRPGDVVLESVSAPGLSWTLPRERPELSVLEVVGEGPSARLVERARVGP